MENIDSYHLLSLVPLTVFGVLGFSVFIYCYYGSRVTAKPKQLAQCFYDTPWFTLPIDHQKKIGLMIAYGQLEIYYSGYGIIKCSLETFSHVCKSLCDKSRAAIFFLFINSPKLLFFFVPDYE